MVPLHCSGKRLEADIVCAAVSAEGDELEVFLDLARLLKYVVSSFHARAWEETVMTLMQMEYVIALYKEGSMNKAAKKFFISQSALSSTLKNLEEELGTTLFERSNQGLTPTADGAYLISQISPIVEYSRNIEQRFAQKKYSDGLKLSVS